MFYNHTQTHAYAYFPIYNITLMYIYIYLCDDECVIFRICPQVAANEMMQHELSVVKRPVSMSFPGWPDSATSIGSIAVEC